MKVYRNVVMLVLIAAMPFAGCAAIQRVLSDFAPNWLFGVGCETVAPSPGE
jgi:hypothetical protein